MGKDSLTRISQNLHVRNTSCQGLLSTIHPRLTVYDVVGKGLLERVADVTNSAKQRLSSSHLLPPQMWILVDNQLTPIHSNTSLIYIGRSETQQNYRWVDWSPSFELYGKSSKQFIVQQDKIPTAGRLKSDWSDWSD